MGCLKLYTKEEIKGTVLYMSNKNKPNKNRIKTDTAPQAPEKKGFTHRKGFKTFITVTPCLALLGGFFGFFYHEFKEIESRFDGMHDEIGKCLTEEDINQMNDDVIEMKKYLYNDEGVQDQLGDIASDINEIKSLLNITAIIASPDLTSIIDTISIEPNDKNPSYASLVSTTCIGTDSDGKAYIAEDLIGEKILLTYSEDDKEVYFLGQYNENYHWNGYCVTNTYNLDDTLDGICESNFDDGRRLDYKSFCESESNAHEWIYSDKVCNENNNSGTNILCSFDYDKEKNFTNTNVRITDIIYVDDFVENIKPTVRTYYSGNTADGKYNDDTGNAYEIIYNDDGTIKTLYVGKFEDGTFNDDTGNAWDIAYLDEGGYYYNTGEFKNGHAVNRSTTPIDIDRINQIIVERGQKFDVELKWKED